MIEQVYPLARGTEKIVEKVLFDENIHYLHMIFQQGEGLPIHYSNATVYMSVIRGRLSISLDDQETKEYEEATLLKIPIETKMNVRNLHTDLLELIVIKAPAPSI
jgi:quercetin dioxygenase-like cupin family protein